MPEAQAHVDQQLLGAGRSDALLSEGDTSRESDEVLPFGPWAALQPVGLDGSAKSALSRPLQVPVAASSYALRCQLSPAAVVAVSL